MAHNEQEQNKKRLDEINQKLKIQEWILQNTTMTEYSEEEEDIVNMLSKEDMVKILRATASISNNDIHKK